MYEVVVKQAGEIVVRKTFTSELAAWAYLALNEDLFDEVEFRNLNYPPK